jgi:hypothetical protein
MTHDGEKKAKMRIEVKYVSRSFTDKNVFLVFDRAESQIRLDSTVSQWVAD